MRSNFANILALTTLATSVAPSLAAPAPLYISDNTVVEVPHSGNGPWLGAEAAPSKREPLYISGDGNLVEVPHSGNGPWLGASVAPPSNKREDLFDRNIGSYLAHTLLPAVTTGAISTIANDGVSTLLKHLHHQQRELDNDLVVIPLPEEAAQAGDKRGLGKFFRIAGAVLSNVLGVGKREFNEAYVDPNSGLMLVPVHEEVAGEKRALGAIISIVGGLGRLLGHKRDVDGNIMFIPLSEETATAGQKRGFGKFLKALGGFASVFLGGAKRDISDAHIDQDSGVMFIPFPQGTSVGKRGIGKFLRFLGGVASTFLGGAKRDVNSAIGQDSDLTFIPLSQETGVDKRALGALFKGLATGALGVIANKIFGGKREATIDLPGVVRLGGLGDLHLAERDLYAESDKRALGAIAGIISRFIISKGAQNAVHKIFGREEGDLSAREIDAIIDELAARDDFGSIPIIDAREIDELD